jgi:hypothetical protein
MKYQYKILTRKFEINCILHYCKLPIVLYSRFVCLNNSVFQTVVSLNPLKTKRKLFYFKNQFVPRSKHFSSLL